MGPAGVEVTQRHRSQAVRRIVLRQRLFDDQLGPAIGIDWRLGRGLADRLDLWNAIDGRRTGKHHAADALIAHDIHQVQRARHVVVVVDRRVGHRLPDRDQAGEVHDRRRPVGLDHLGQPPAVADVALLQRPEPGQGAKSVAQIVVDHGGIAAPRERFAGVASDVARPAGHQHAWSIGRRAVISQGQLRNGA